MESSIPGHVTVLYLFTIVNLIALFHVSLVNAEITVVDTVNNITVAKYDDIPAMFGDSLPSEGINGRLVYVKPHNACTIVEKPPNHMHLIPMVKWIALIAREGCDFAEKVFNAQKAGYDTAIVFNTIGNDDLVKMGGDGRQVSIPSVFVGYSTGKDMADNFDYRKNNILITMDGGIPIPNYKVYLWPFAIVVGTCFCLMVIFMIAKWCRDRRRRNRSRLSTKHLKKIPIKKFKKGDNYDVCAICLDDYEEGDKLRILPCSHAYHRKCIDPWLTKNRKTCPICKRRVIPGEENESDSDSDEDGGSTSRAEPTERTPLLASQPAASTPRTSTFDNSGLPESVRAEVTGLQQVVDSSEDSDGSIQGAVGGMSVQVEDKHLIDSHSGSSSGASNTSLPSRKDNASVSAGSSRSRSTPPRSTTGQFNTAFREEDEVSFVKEDKKLKLNQVV
ncbi:hypothetical protein SNE40_021359 [Patella caerulea]|uniref:RING-type E3 ubiquitin transferase n=1 Tax=Patella caerulea TaxID=87958 RepID=A0AAN8G7U9_PATCE